jgi:peptidoglycan/LPS O-acetylase OafA/YrhL
LSESTYRPDIDGLRAVAVLSVLLFHLRVPGFPGGYVGVDVFFVISGFLITGLLRKSISAGTLSLKEFYLRRIRRLAPALLAVSIVTALVSWWKLYPEDMSSFGSSLALQPLSLQNFFFLADGEYFRGAEAKPLLHTWSLAVEEQFYFFWPLILLFCSRLSSQKRSRLLLLALAIASFALNLVLMKVTAKASFFLLPSRAWELGVGAAIAFADERRQLAGWLTPPRASALAALGLAAIAAAVLSFTDSTPFPGFAAALPVFGAAAVLAAGVSPQHALKRALSSGPVVHLGLISYPLYLWHWPVLAFWRYGNAHRVGGWHSLAILLVSLALAEATYRLIERPVRQRRWLGAPTALVGISLGAAVTLMSFGLHVRNSEGAAYRFSGVARALLTAPFRSRSDRCGFVFRTVHPFSQVCALRTDPNPERKVLLWGTSHADQWSGLFLELAAAHHASLYLNARNCRATPDHSFCGAPVQKAVLGFAVAKHMTDVVLASSWFGRYRVPDDVLERDLVALVNQLVAHGIRTWLVIDTPNGPELDPIAAFERKPQEPAFGAVPATPLLQRGAREERFFQSLAAAHPAGLVHIVNPTARLCDGDVCPGGRADVAWYRDTEHLTNAGAKLAAPSFAPVFGAE